MCRIQAFFFIHVTTLVTEFIAPPLAAVLLNTCGSHFAFLAAVSFELAALLALGLIKEPPREDRQESAQSAGEHGDDNDSQALESKLAFKQPFIKVMQYLRQDVGGLLSQKALMLGLLAVVGCRLGRPMLELILQYMSVKFGWHFSKVGHHCAVLKSENQSDRSEYRQTICFLSRPLPKYSFSCWFSRPLVRGWFERKDMHLRRIWRLHAVLS